MQCMILKVPKFLKKINNKGQCWDTQICIWIVRGCCYIHIKFLGCYNGNTVM